MSKDGESIVRSGTDPSQQNPTAPVTERVLNVLDSEIENVRDAQTRQGWTSWGLVGGIIASLWLLSDELKSENLRIEIVAAAILIFTVLIDSLRWLIYLLWQGATPRTEPIRFRWSNEFFSGNELVFVIEILRSVGLLIVAWMLAPKWWLSLGALSVAYLWYLIMAILWLTLTLTEFPVRQGMTKKGLAFILLFVIPCFISFLSYLRLAPFPNAEVVGSYRTGGLLVAMSYLILSLGVVTKDSPVLQSLIGIRRNIAFNRVDINSAVTEAEIALSGMQVPDAIQRDIHLILVLVDRLNEATNNLINQVQTMQTHLPRAEDSQEVISAKLRILTTHRSTCQFVLTDRESSLKELNSKFQQLMKRRQRIQGVIPEASDFFNQLDSGMKTILEEADRRFAHYVEQANAYDKQLSAIKIPSDKRE
jgi:hypothetical protein